RPGGRPRSRRGSCARPRCCRRRRRRRPEGRARPSRSMPAQLPAAGREASLSSWSPHGVDELVVELGVVVVVLVAVVLVLVVLVLVVEPEVDVEEVGALVVASAAVVDVDALSPR